MYPFSLYLMISYHLETPDSVCGDHDEADVLTKSEDRYLCIVIKQTKRKWNYVHKKS